MLCLLKFVDTIPLLNYQTEPALGALFQYTQSVPAPPTLSGKQSQAGTETGSGIDIVWQGYKKFSP